MDSLVFLKIRIRRRHMVANHNQRILPVILIIPLAHAQFHKAKAFVQVLRPQVAAPNLQRRISRAEVGQVLQQMQLVKVIS